MNNSNREFPLEQETKIAKISNPDGKRWLADMNLLFVALIWGVNMPVMKFALGHMDKYMFNFMRLSCSTIVLGILVYWQGASFVDRREGAKPIRQQVFSIIMFSLMAGFAYQVLFMLGISSTSAGNTALILTTMPMWAALLALILLKERLSRTACVGLAIALIGTIIVTLVKNQAAAGSTQTSTLAGNLLVCAAAFSWAFCSVISRPIMRSISPLSLAFCSVGLALPLHLFISRHAIGDIGSVFSSPMVILAVIYSGTFSTGLAYVMYNFGVQQLGAGHASAYQNLVPLVAIVASWVILSEIPFPMQIVGGVLIVSGLIVMRRKRQLIPG